MKYHSEAYNKVDETEQWIRLTDGCHRNCWNCYCPIETKVHPGPNIERNKVVILDMNFLYAHPNPLAVLEHLGSQKVKNKVVYYDFFCGVDFELLTPDICDLLKQGRFGRFNNKRKYAYGLRIAWDRSIKEQIKIQKALRMLEKAGYNSRNHQVFILANGRISFIECVLKLEFLKVWNVEVADCWYDNQLRGSVKPIYWTQEECNWFGFLCRIHNQLIEYKMYPQLDWILRRVLKNENNSQRY